MQDENNILFYGTLYGYNATTDLLMADGEFLPTWKGYDDDRVEKTYYFINECIEPAQTIPGESSIDIISYKKNEFWFFSWFPSEEAHDFSYTLDGEENDTSSEEMMKKIIAVLEDFRPKLEKTIPEKEEKPIKEGVLGLLFYGDSPEMFELNTERINELAEKKGVHELIGNSQLMYVIGGLKDKSFKFISHLNDGEIRNELGIIDYVSYLKIE
ncbi:hypothetical protein Murru_1043 [Allomuricauda ruestringensis DSM 13258]|uniref:Uncharacterized protein n=1 Tax=Allomuricauda ruestringensis (strain DSM 13258 / CIP 107369 / LMG 19739 / B1) TaxID=886377 RepID=G2PM49_ALLRU|nr:hypothetical protein [Allomuricauda ruestringensis]AEM70090.1 hypothetical protein Murru_1043 [Allomuricauda ruestringensis DSM 13258]